MSAYSYLLTVISVVLLLWASAWNLRSARSRQALLLLASYFFYSSWGVGFLIILIASSLLNFTLGSLLRRRPTAGCLWLGVALNLTLLGFFKYLPPLLHSGWAASWQPEFLHTIVMPMGISFWTFQGLSYLFDVYREEEVDPSLLEFCLYMAFWPTVLSGPVCRLPSLLPQFRAAPVFSWHNISVGAFRLIQGLFMKLILAQLLGSGLVPGGGITAGFDQVKSGLGAVDVWLLAIGFGFQLFFDFAGYSHMVIGVARMFGIEVPENFCRPFLSTTPSIFWTRWHMSLSSWIRDYVFVPLAAAGRYRWWPYAVFVISMTLFGLWHAAKLTFIFWGLYHGLLLVAHRLGQQVKRRFAITLPGFWGITLSWAVTFSSISLGWIFFRVNDLDQAFSMFRTVLSPYEYQRLAMPRSFYLFIFLVAAGYFVCEGLRIWWTYARARHREVMDQVPSVIGQGQSAGSSSNVMVVEVFEFFAVRMWWWLTPIVFVLTFFVSSAMQNRSSVVSVTPFMYTIF
jgi:alginate O-acetyltransferase complex protein AlgI